MSCFSVILLPEHQLVSTPGGSAGFFCRSLGAGHSVHSIQWLVNGSLVETVHLPNVMATFAAGLGRLDFTNIPVEYNETIVRCVGTFPDGTTSTSPPSSLLLQGEAWRLHTVVHVSKHRVYTIAASPISILLASQCQVASYIYNVSCSI